MIPSGLNRKVFGSIQDKVGCLPFSNTHTHTHTPKHLLNQHTRCNSLIHTRLIIQVNILFFSLNCTILFCLFWNFWVIGLNSTIIQLALLFLLHWNRLTRMKRVVFKFFPGKSANTLTGSDTYQQWNAYTLWLSNFISRHFHYRLTTLHKHPSSLFSYGAECSCRKAHTQADRSHFEYESTSQMRSQRYQ